MKKIDTALPLPRNLQESLWTYCGLDSCVTYEVFNALLPLQTENSRKIYSFERSLMNPALEMMRRGVRVDQVLRSKHLSELSEKKDTLERQLNLMAETVRPGPLNARSLPQLTSFFYSSLHYKPIYHTHKGTKKISMNREVLEKLKEEFFAEPFAATILAIRDLSKLVEVLSAGVDTDSRIRVSYNVAGTETGRWSSSKNVFGGGTNFQNITPGIRDIFISDPGYLLAYADLEQAESRVVAYLSNDPAYIDACESTDLHAIVAKMVFSIPDSRIRAPYYRHFSYRDIAKRAGHATNYMVSPFTLSRYFKLPVSLCEEFQRLYFTAFPEIRKWHHSVQVALQTKGRLVTPFGRERQFLGRKYDDTTLREAVAYVPQSTVADLLNLSLFTLYTSFPNIQLLAQIHDAILFQFPENDIPLALSAASAMSVPIKISGKEMKIPVEVKIGWDWKNMVSPGKPLPKRREIGTLLDFYL